MNVSRRSVLASAAAGVVASVSRRAPAAGPGTARRRAADLPPARPAPVVAPPAAATRHFGIHDDLAATRARYGAR